MRGGRGKSGAYRICYVHLPEYGTVALVVIFGKSEKDNLNRADRHSVSKVIEAYREELRKELKRGRIGNQTDV